MKKTFLIAVMVTVLGTISFCSGSEVRLKVTNVLKLERQGEIVAVSWEMLQKRAPDLNAGSVVVFDEATDREVISQVSGRELIFQTDLKPQWSRYFIVRNGPEKREKTSPLVDGRYVEPREDYAWENDRIAFRVYGPALAKEVGNGIDVWTKRVRYLVVGKWYENAAGDNEGSYYHTDRGEGADFFSVGKSLGCGGNGIWYKGKVYQPGVFSSYETIENGPLRVLFELHYDSLGVDGKLFKETMRVTLDAGQNLNKIEVTYAGPAVEKEIQFACGLVKRDNTTEYKDKRNGWISLWGLTNSDSTNGFLGTGVVIPKPSVIGMNEDKDQYLLLGKIRNGASATYYSGASWSRMGDVLTAKEWNGYLSRFVTRLSSPLRVSIAGKAK